jgi:hypothetical protein
MVEWPNRRIRREYVSTLLLEDSAWKLSQRGGLVYFRCYLPNAAFGVWRCFGGDGFRGDLTFV